MGGASFSIADIAAFTTISAVSRHLSWERGTIGSTVGPLSKPDDGV
jgi:hypothetical protein